MKIPPRKKGLNQRGKIPGWMVDAITNEVARSFPSFGGPNRTNYSNPITHWMHGKPAQFALGVNIRDVVSHVLHSARRK